YTGLNQTFENPPPGGPLLAIQLPTGNVPARLKWKFDSPAFAGTFTSAAIAEDIVFVVGDGDPSVLFALNAADGAELWRATLPGDHNLYANPIVRFGKVFVGTGDSLTVFAAGRTKRCYGHYEFDDLHMNTPVVTYDRIYVAV